MAGKRGPVTVRRSALLKHVAFLRTLFRTLDLDVTRYGDETIVDAVLAVSSVLDDTWPSDEQLHEAFRRLSIPSS